MYPWAAVLGDSCALDANGYVWAWGYNQYGAIGNGYSGGGEWEDTPVQVKKDGSMYLTDIVYINAGFDHSLAIDVNGDIWVWGRNQTGQLGLMVLFLFVVFG